jgi:bifunctional non-homologous end joining protein LigD
VQWDELDRVTPADFTVHTVAPLIEKSDPWTEQMPTAQRLDRDLVEEGRAIPIPRVQAMHEGRRRARRSHRPRS